MPSGKTEKIMSIKSIAAKLFAQKNLYENTSTTNLLQVKSCFAGLIKDAKTTEFGIDHHFDQIKTFEDFAEQVPIRDYEDLKPMLKSGKRRREYPLEGKPLYFAKTSGTTSGAKYIPF
jgi:hypothetical protein